ncbi:MAG: glycosyltransferase family 4 protein [Vampirovibrionales bacterium]
MKKKLALVIHSLDALLLEEGIKGGANRLNFELLNQLLLRDDIEFTLITQKGWHTDYKGCTIFFFEGSIYTDREHVLTQIDAYAQAHPDVTLLFSDIMAPFGNLLLQSHSLPHRRAGDWWAIRWLSQLLNQAKIKNKAENFHPLDVQGQERRILTVSQAVKDDYVRHFHFPSHQVHVAYPGVYSTSGIEVSAVRKPVAIGMVNSRALNKGGLLFLSVMGLIKVLGMSFHLVLIHPDLERDALAKFFIQLFQLNERLEILPFQADMTSFYDKIDALVLPSLNEAFGLVVLEAMAYGVLPIVSSTAGVAELIRHGENGLCFNRTQSPFWSLFQTIKHFISFHEDEVHRLKTEALVNSNQYTWQDFTEKVIQSLWIPSEVSSISK